MARNVCAQASPAVVAQRLCDVLQTFPAAATSGVQWTTLTRKYEERHSTRLDFESLGHSSSLTAASSLLWDVVRFVNVEDTDNPVVGIEASVALTPRPGFLSTWPSLYVSFCEAVRVHGSPEKLEARVVGPSSGCARSLLFSQLKPFLQSHWHANFNECGLNYFSDEGKFVGLKKMKHLVTAVLRWRAEYAERRLDSPQACGDLDELLRPQLELMKSKDHNDLVLRYVPSDQGTDEPYVSSVFGAEYTPQHTVLPAMQRQDPFASDVDISESEACTTDLESVATLISSRSSSSTDREWELARLRLENAQLLGQNEQLKRRSLFEELFNTPRSSQAASEPELFDDPFEPPPEARASYWGVDSPIYSGASGIATPLSSASGAATPVMSFPATQVPTQFCAMVPVWFEQTKIPNGIVQQARAFFEKPQAAMPSFFCRGFGVVPH